MLRASAHTPESFGRAIISASLAAAENGDSGGRQPTKMQFDVTVTPIRGIRAGVIIGIPGFRTICTIERGDRVG